MVQRQRKVLGSLVAGALVALLTISGTVAGDLRLIDAHSQFDRDVEPERIVPLLDRAGIVHVILSTRRGRSWRDVVRLATDHPDRVTASVRTKGQHFLRNKKKYYQRLKAQLNDSAFGAMAEAIIWHAEKGNKAPKMVVALAAPQVQAALAAAMARKWPFVIHIEFRSAKTAGDFDEQMAALTSVLRRYSDHPFALTHLGQLSATEARSLLAAHANLHLLTSHANESFTRQSSQPWTVMVEGDAIVSNWRQLVIDYPHQFVFAIDNVWEDHWGTFYVDQVKSWRKALSQLPPDVAQAVAHKNAERLWGLKPLQ